MSGSAGQAGVTSGAGGGSGGASSGAGGSISNGGSSNDAGSGGASSGAGGVPSSGSGGTGGSAIVVSECPCSAPTPSCVAGKCVVRGPDMIKAEGFYIDSTEVTVGQYAVFQKAKGSDTSGQASECSWNTSFDPEFDPQGVLATEKDPVTNIDYCDAAAYCAWADKRLCGKIGGGDLQLAELADPTKSQWFEACAGPKQQPYPYGTTYQKGYCNDASGALTPVASEAMCQGYYPNLYDMIGNAQEWVDACQGNSGATDGCERIGGSYQMSAMCSESGLAQRNLTAPDLGFRCCSQ